MVLISSGLRTRDASQDKHSDRSQVEIHQGLVDRLSRQLESERGNIPSSGRFPTPEIVESESGFYGSNCPGPEA